MILRMLTSSAAVMAALFSFPVHAQEAKRLTGDEIRALIADNQMTAVNSRGQKYTETYKADGTFSAISEGSSGGTVADDGRWTVEGDRFCKQYDNWQDGRKRCAPLLKGSDGYTTGTGQKLSFKRS
jgi:hypothetical protein